jgi:transmembrane sensor
VHQQPASAASRVPGAVPKVTPELAAEAAVWVARLHGPSRSPHMERECLEWQARSAAHRLAFERCTDAWQEVPSVTLASAYATAEAAVPASAAPSWPPHRPRWPRALAAAAMLAVVAVALHLSLSRDGNAYSTGVGEQQVVVLDDGSRVSLNTATRVRVELSATQRTVNLERGEALFEVAKDAHRPFVVRVAGSEVVAVGTVFSVRLTADGAQAGDKLAVTLIEGQVAVRPVAQGSATGAAPARALLMQPGERVRLASARTATVAAVQVDTPRIEQVMAWKRSEAVFDDVSLQEAVAEMNRYSRTPIVLAGEGALAERRISGLFRTGDNAGFASAVAALHGLAVHERQGQLELAPRE